MMKILFVVALVGIAFLASPGRVIESILLFGSGCVFGDLAQSARSLAVTFKNVAAFDALVRVIAPANPVVHRPGLICRPDSTVHKPKLDKKR